MFVQAIKKANVFLIKSIYFAIAKWNQISFVRFNYYSSFLLYLNNDILIYYDIADDTEDTEDLKMNNFNKDDDHFSHKQKMFFPFLENKHELSL